MEEGYATTSGGSIHYQKAGEGEPLVLLHSLGNSCESWEQVVPALSQSCTLYALDLPGHGRSAKPSQAFLIPDYARGVREFMDELNIDRASIIGNSIGGMITVAFSAAYPERVARAVLVGCPGWDTPAEREERLALSLSNLDADGNPRKMTMEEISARYRNPTPQLLEKVNTTRAQAGTWMGVAMRALCQYDITADLPKVCCPTLVLFGDKDELINKEQVLLGGIEGCQRAVIQNAGHLPQVDDPEAFSRVVLAFLGQS